MAREEIKLVGSFDDQITKKLQKLNREITNMSRSFERFNKKLAPVTKSFAKMAMSAQTFSNAMQTQRAAIDSSARSMREYSRQAGKMSGAMRKVSAEREKARRASGQSRAQARKGGGDNYGMPAPSSGGTTKGGAGQAVGRQAGAGFMQSVKASVIGSTIGNIAAQGIMSGVQKLKGLMMMPFQKFGSMFAERIGDEMDDIKSAGGLFALDMDLTQASGNERFFKNYNEALRFQEKLNIDMAQSAASLPGVTQQYVDVSRQLTDTIQMVQEKDREGFNTMAQAFGADVSGGGVEASKNAFQTVLKKQTEQLVLQSQGQTGGLPMHIAIQQLMNADKINMQAFTNKFRAAFQKNPLLKNFLMRAEADLQNTAAGSSDRLKILMETFDAAMPKEVINKMRGSISGMMEALRSGLLDPQSGLFGMSRASIDPKTGKEIMKKNVDDLGNTLFEFTKDLKIDEALSKKLEDLGIDKKAGETLKGFELTAEQLTKLGYTVDKISGTVSKGDEIVGKFSMSTTYIFEQIREILAGYGPVLLEFVGYLPLLFDPFAEMTNSLKDFRDEAQAFVNVFNNKLGMIEDVALKFKQMKDPEKQGLGTLLLGQSRARAAFSTVAETLEKMGGIDKQLLDRVQKITGDTSEAGIKAIEDGALGQVVPDLLKSLFNSDLMKKFGNIGGLIIGGITKAVVEFIKRITGLAKGEGTNKLTEGFIDGFKQAFGDMDFNEAKSVISDAIVSILSKGLDLVFTQVLPNLLHMYVGGLFQGLAEGGLTTKILSAIGIAKLALFLKDGVMKVAQVISYLSPLLKSLGGILMTVIKGVASAFLPVIMPVLAVAGAVMIVIAVVRNFGSIMQMVGGILKMVAGQIVQNFSRMIGALGHFIKFIGTMAGPLGGKIRELGDGMLGAGQGLKDFGQGLKDEGLKDVKDAASSMAQQFEEDTGKIKEFATGMNPATTAMGEFVGATNDATQAQKEATAATIKRFDADTRVALLKAGVSGSQIEAMETRQTEVDDQLALLRAGKVHGPVPVSPAAPAGAPTSADPSGAQAAMSSVEAGMNNVKAASDPAAKALENVKSGADSSSKALDSLASQAEAIPPKVEAALMGAATSAGNAITTAAQSLAQALNQAAQSIKNAASASAAASTDTAKGAYGGSGNMTKSMPLADAIATEKKNMPSGAGLVIANTSETIIPAFAGHAGDGFKGLSFAELESAAGFDRMASYTDQIAEIADKTAASFMGGFGGALGGGSATLNAMEALGHSFGLVTTSGHRPGDPGFHGVNRARDLSNGGGETPEMNAAAAKMASEFGSSLTELIYTPMGFSIKNGQKTGLISPANHYHHIHVAVAEGLQKAAVFSSQQAAEKYERSMMPAGSEPMKVNLGSMTANSSEVGGVQIGSINISGVDDPKEIADQVADEILAAVRRSSYTELFSS